MGSGDIWRLGSANELCPKEPQHDHTSCADLIRSLPKSLIRRLILGLGRFWGFERKRLFATVIPVSFRPSVPDSVPTSWKNLRFRPGWKHPQGAFGKLPLPAPTIPHFRPKARKPPLSEGK